MQVRCLSCMSSVTEEDACCPQCGRRLLPPSAWRSVQDRKREIADAENKLAEESLSQCSENAAKKLSSIRNHTREKLFGASAETAGGITESRPAGGTTTRIGTPTVFNVGEGWGKDSFDLAIDVLRPCIVGNNTLRVYLAVNRGQFDDVSLRIKPHIGIGVEPEQLCGDLISDDASHCDCERIFTLGNLPEGSMGCDIVLSCVRDGLHRQYIGQIELNVNRREDLMDVVQQNISIHYNPQTCIGNVAQASDVKILHKSDDGMREALEGITCGENPMSAIDLMSRAGDRTYRKVPMKSMSGDGLGEAPAEAKGKEIELCIGYERIQIFADDIVCIGHSVDNVRYSDIVIDAPNAAESLQYDRISRIHCMIRHYGPKVEICDGRLDGNGGIVPSANGTIMNSERLQPYSVQRLCDGELRLGTSDSAVRLGVKTVAFPKCRNCRIPKGERIGCSGGERPSVVISRFDGMNVKYVALWSCFDLGNINPDYEGIVIFHYNGAFGWRRGKKVGWLTTGENFGSSQINRITVMKVWDR